MKKFLLFVFLLVLFRLMFGQGISFDEISYWIGTGNKVAMLIIDFNDTLTPQCYAWGYRFEGDSVTAQDMLTDISLADPNLTIVISGGFLYDIIYLNHSGIGGNPDYWATFTFSDTAWILNNGISEILTDSMIFGCSYTPWIQQDTIWIPQYVPSDPVAAAQPTAIFSENSANINFIFPNPFANFINFNPFTEDLDIYIYSPNGAIVKSFLLPKSTITSVSMENYPAGLYLIRAKSQKNNKEHYFKVIKK